MRSLVDSPAIHTGKSGASSLCERRTGKSPHGSERHQSEPRAISASAKPGFYLRRSSGHSQFESRIQSELFSVARKNLFGRSTSSVMDRNKSNAAQVNTWVDERMSALNSAENWQPNVNAGFARLGELKISARRIGERTILLATAAVAAIFLSIIWRIHRRKFLLVVVLMNVRWCGRAFHYQRGARQT